MNRHGFTLIELVVVLAIGSLVAMSALTLLGRMYRDKQRIEAQRDLYEAKAALLDHADRLDILAQPEAGWYLPATDLRLKRKDAFDARLRYCVNADLTDKTTSCAKLKNLIKNDPVVVASWYPKVWMEWMSDSGGAMPVAAVIISPAADNIPNKLLKDIDGDGTPDLLVGDNSNTCSSADPNFVQASLIDKSFDDLLTYISIPELYDVLACEN